MIRNTYRLLATSGPFNPYKILGVEQTASKEEIKRAYHRLALRFHPDGGPEGNAERFAAVHEAYESVKDGKWKPSAEQQRATMEKEGHGWDPSTRMYVYEKPGSTTENYVTGHTQTLLRLAMVWCFLFVVVRFFLLWVFPHRRTDAPTLDPSFVKSKDAGHPAASVHSDDEEEGGLLYAMDTKGSNESRFPYDNVNVDPLSRRAL